LVVVVGLRIAYFAFSEYFPSFDAGYTHTIEIVNALQNLGVDVTLFGKKGKGNRVFRDAKFVGVDFPTGFRQQLSLSNANAPREYFSFKRALTDFDLIHERFSAGINPYSYLLVKNTRLPRVLEINFPLVAHAIPRLLHRLEKKLYFMQLKASKAIVTQTETLRKIIVGELREEDIPVYVVPNGVDVELFRKVMEPTEAESFRRGIGLEKDDIVITFVGSFREWHGVDQITVVAKRLLDEYIKVKFLLIGGGHLYSRFKGSLPSTLRRCIILVGPQPYKVIPKFLGISDILIAPYDVSNYKYMEKMGFWWCPVKLFEYMASSKPIVSYDFAEIRKVVRDSALLASPGNVDQFIYYLSLLIENPRLGLELGEKARRIAEKCTWERRAEELIKIYRMLLP